MCTSLSYDYINGYLYVNSNGNPLITEPIRFILSLNLRLRYLLKFQLKLMKKWNQSIDNDDEFIHS